jgi:hypothetical protein
MGTTAAIIDSTLITDRGSRDKLGREMVKAQLARARTKLRFLMRKSLGGRISRPPGTENGVANLKGPFSTERAQASIALAHPAFQDGLTAAAKENHLL